MEEEEKEVAKYQRQINKQREKGQKLNMDDGRRFRGALNALDRCQVSASDENRPQQRSSARWPSDCH